MGGMVAGQVKMRADGRQSVKGQPGSEVWYFDAVLDDGSKFAGGFRNKSVAKANQKDDEPLMVVTIRARRHEAFRHDGVSGRCLLYRP